MLTYCLYWGTVKLSLYTATIQELFWVPPLNLSLKRKSVNIFFASHSLIVALITQAYDTTDTCASILIYQKRSSNWIQASGKTLSVVPSSLSSFFLITVHPTGSFAGDDQRLMLCSQAIGAANIFQNDNCSNDKKDRTRSCQELMQLYLRLTEAARQNTL